MPRFPQMIVGAGIAFSRDHANLQIRVAIPCSLSLTFLPICGRRLLTRRFVPPPSLKVGFAFDGHLRLSFQDAVVYCQIRVYDYYARMEPVRLAPNNRQVDEKPRSSRNPSRSPVHLLVP